MSPNILNGIHFSASTALRLLLATFFACGYEYAGVRIEMSPVPSMPALPQATRIVTSIRDLALRPPQDRWERDILAASERSFELVLPTPLGGLVGMATAKGDAGDVLVASWHPGDSSELGVRGFSTWDAPEDTWFLIECDQAKFASASSAESFLKQLLRWNSIPDLRLQVKFALSSPANLAGSMVVPWVRPGGEYFLYGIRHESEAYLLIQVGKSYFYRDYPEGGSFVPERFPPLKQLVSTWNKDRLLSEVDRTWLVRGPMANYNSRDAILVSAAVQRGLDRSDLERLLLATNAPDSAAVE
jgi:hypothetical protein